MKTIITFNLDKYEGNYCMHCKTEEEAKSFCEYLHSIGRKWKYSGDYSHCTLWFNFQQDTVYYFNEGLSGCKEFAEKRNYIILEWSDFIEKEFTKSDLKNGMVVEYANGQKGMVLNGKIIDNTGFCSFREYSEDLYCVEQSFNIEKIYFSNPDKFQEILYSKNLTLIWERNPRKKMTKEEIEFELGYKIEIVEK